MFLVFHERNAMQPARVDLQLIDAPLIKIDLKHRIERLNRACWVGRLQNGRAYHKRRCAYRR